MTAIERTTKLATVTDDLPAAWAFIMAHVDTLGPSPRVYINPIWWCGDDGDNVRKFEVSVSGMVPDPEADA